MKIIGLTKEDFWNEVQKSSPTSFKKFSDYIDDFKESCNWDQLFSIGIVRNEYDDYDVKFHDLPFAMQEGIIENFFLLDNIAYNSFRSPSNPELWYFHVIDMTTGKILSLFKDDTHVKMAEFSNFESVKIVAIGVAFQLLHDNYIKNFN